MRRSSGVAIATVLGLLSLTLSGRALAYCRTSSCPNVGTAAVCSPPRPNDCGTPLYWALPCIGYSINQKASSQVSFATATQIFQTAFATWEGADCGGGQHPRLQIEDMGAVACDKHEYNQAEGNANAIIFRDDGWPYMGANSTLALTTVTYNLDTGEIYDADMELNSAGAKFTTDDQDVQYDLPSIVQHETGHFLGLAHSTETDATMFPDYQKGSTSLRTLSPDDISAICTVYPPGPIPSPCDPTPRHGFSSECGTGKATTSGGCCAVAPGGGDDSGGAALVALGGLALATLGRRKRPRPR